MRYRSVFGRLITCCCTFVAAVAMVNGVAAQDETPKPPPATAPSTSTELVEGLLDLLNEPPSNKSVEAKEKAPITPADVGLEGEDLGEAPENPLQAVRQSMLIAAAYLTRDGANQDTMKLQSDIVRRLDDLIAEMEKSQSQKNNSKQDSEQSKTSQSKTQQQQNKQQSQVAKKPSNDQREPGEGEQQKERTGEPENPPTQRGAQGSVAVELADPKALQQDVWGQLPSRVRQQMQSRMVEQFLPAYREQIEAYFQALLK